MRPLPRAQRERGCPRRLPGSPGRGLCLFAGLPAHRAEGPQPSHELGGGGGVRLRLGHAPLEHLLASPEQALGVRARPLLRGEAEVGRHLPAGAEPREVADLGREGGGEREPASLDRLERLDLGREGARRDGGPVLGEEGLPRLVGRLDLVPQRRERPDVSVNVTFTIFTNVFSPIAPTRMRRIRQRGCAAFGA